MSVKKNDLFMGLYLLAAVIFFIISIPSWLLDIMLAINIGIALIILFNTLYAKEVLDIGGISTMLLFYDIVSYFVKCIFNKTDFKKMVMPDMLLKHSENLWAAVI